MNAGRDLTIEKVRDLAAHGESETVEFKRSTAEHERGARTVCAMANQRGGAVLFGVDTDGTPVGQQVSVRTMERLVQSLAEIRPHPPYTVQRCVIDADREVLAVIVERGADRPYRFRGRAYVRSGAVTEALTEERAQQITVETRHAGNRWELEPASVGRAVLDEAEIAAAVRDGIALGRIPPDAATDLDGALQGFNLLTDDGEITNAAVALFGRRMRSAPPTRSARCGSADSSAPIALPW